MHRYSGYLHVWHVSVTIMMALLNNSYTSLRENSFLSQLFAWKFISLTIICMEIHFSHNYLRENSFLSQLFAWKFISLTIICVRIHFSHNYLNENSSYSHSQLFSWVQCICLSLYWKYTPLVYWLTHFCSQIAGEKICFYINISPVSEEM